MGRNISGEMGTVSSLAAGSEASPAVGLCDALAAEDVRIRVFHKQNGGSSSARNLGIQEATGEYLGFVDSDDYVEPDMYERLLQAIETTHLPIAQTGRDEIDPEGKKLPNICEPVT